MAKSTKAKQKISLLELSETCRRVLYYFFDYPNTAIGLNDLAESVGASKTSAREAVLLLEKQGYVGKEIIGNAWRLFAIDPAEVFFAMGKIPYNLQLIYDSPILGTIYKKVQGAKAIILFGSYRWGTNDETSDIDVAVEVSGDEDLQIMALGFVDIGFRKKVKVNLHIFSRSKISLELFTNIANGIVLSGLLEVKQ